MIVATPGLDFGFLHQAPGKTIRIPDFSAPARIAGQLIAEVGHQAFADEIEGIEELRKNDHSPAIVKNRREALAKGFKFAVFGDLPKRGDIVLQVTTLFPKFIPPLRIVIDAEQTTALLIHSRPTSTSSSSSSSSR